MERDEPIDEASAGPSVLTNLAYNRIRSLILYQQLRPGERTSVVQLSNVTGLGRAPVKSAVERLAAEGLLQVRGRSGTSVAKLDPDGVRHLFELRTLYESAASGMIVERASDVQMQTLQSHIPRLSGRLSDPPTQLNAGISSMVQFIDKDVEFHKLIIGCAGNPYLDEAYSSLNLHLLISHYLILDGGSRAAEREQEHIAIADALQRRDSVGLEAALREHADSVRDAILATMSALARSR